MLRCSTCGDPVAECASPEVTLEGKLVVLCLDCALEQIKARKERLRLFTESIS